jgi:hypothetical protein
MTTRTLIKGSADAEQAWFWTPEWQEGEQQATREAEAGEGVVYESGDDFLVAFKPR